MLLAPGGLSLTLCSGGSRGFDQSLRPLRMDTLYTLCRSADNRYAPPFTPEQAAEIVAHKQSHFAREAAENPLVNEVLTGGSVTYQGLEQDDRHGFLHGPATFFRTHEILRRTRRHNALVRIGGCEYPHNTAAALFARCIPNARLQHLPWFSMARYTTSLALVWGLTLLIGHLIARDNPDAGLLDAFVCYHLGLGGTILALAYASLRRNRDFRQASPWNSAVYLDLNADLVRRGSPALAAARKEFLPRQAPFKKPAFYYPLSRRIENHGFDEELNSKLPASNLHPVSTSPPGHR